MNSTTKKIIIIAIAAIVVICAATAGILVKNGMDAKANSETTLPSANSEVPNQDIQEPQTFAPLTTPVPSEPVSEIVSNVVQATQNAVKPLKPNKPDTNQNAGGNNVQASKPASNNSGEAPTKLLSDMENIVDNAIGDNTENPALLGYKKNIEHGYYYTDDKDCWQKNAGYNEVYDQMAPVACMFIDQIRIRFTYEHKDWMIQFWKGQYGWLLVGAEIGVYTAPEGTYTGATGDVNHYNCADKSDWLNMQLDCYWSENNTGTYKKVFTREYGKYWWATGFVKGQLTKYSAPRTELKVRGRITFKSAEMADLFVIGLRRGGFLKSGDVSNMVDDSYYQNGADVTVLWSTIQEDCFVGYGE